VIGSRREGDDAPGDYAVVSDGKLTIVGGGWSQTGPEPASFGIALLILVPWDQANTLHRSGQL
jgi:hypothetical protein